MRTTVRYKGIRCDCIASLFVSSRPSVLRFLFCIMPSRSSSRSSSCFASRLVSFRPVRLVRRAVGRNDLAECHLCHLAISSSLVRRPRHCVVPPCRLVLRCVERGVFCRLAALSCVLFRSPGSHVPSLSSVPPCRLDRQDGLAFFCPMSSGILCRLVFSLASLVRSSSSRPRSSSSLSSFMSRPCCLCCRFRSRHSSLPVIASLLPRWRCQLRSL